MSDHVTMINEGRVVLDGTLENVRGAHQRSEIRFTTQLERPPTIEGVLKVEGSGRFWSVVHNGSLERFRASVALQQGEVVQSREATLEEVFVARVGRSPVSAEAA